MTRFLTGLGAALLVPLLTALLWILFCGVAVLALAADRGRDHATRTDPRGG